MSCNRRVVFVVLSTLMAAAAVACASPSTNPDAAVTTSGAGDEERAELIATLTSFRNSVHEKDIDAIMVHFSGEYSSREATGKSAVREWWTRLLVDGPPTLLPLDLETALLQVEGQAAEVIYFDLGGELACENETKPCTGPQPYLDFRLEREPNKPWLITGIPSEDS